MSVYHKLNNILPSVANPVIVEIGAHIGTDTAKIARLLQQPFTYLAVEPDNRNFEGLQKVCSEYGITLIPVVVSNKSGLVNFWQATTKSDFNSLKKPIRNTTRPKDTEFKSIKVQSFTLDKLVELYQLPKVDLLWMDVQGAELEVIGGATEILKKTHYLYTECQEGRYERQPGFAKIMMALGGVWKIVYKDPANVLLRNENV